MQHRRIVILSIHSVCTLLACFGLVSLCYVQIDRPVALLVRDRFGFALDWLKWPDFITAIEIASPILLILAAIARLRRPWRRWEALLVAVACSVFGMTILKQILKFIFGRPCARFWIESGSFLSDDEYAFRWFHGYFPYDAFPSGHMTIGCTVAAIVWILWPKWRWIVAAGAVTLASCLVITNYHFVGDIIAGGCVGWLGGVWTVQLLPKAILPNVMQTQREVLK